MVESAGYNSKKQLYVIKIQVTKLNTLRLVSRSRVISSNEINKRMEVVK